jgi:hypothetical protein
MYASQFFGELLGFLCGHCAKPREGAHKALATGNLDALALAFQPDFLQHTSIDVNKTVLVEGAAEALSEPGEDPRHGRACRAPIYFD